MTAFKIEHPLLNV